MIYRSNVVPDRYTPIKKHGLQRVRLFASITLTTTRFLTGGPSIILNILLKTRFVSDGVVLLAIIILNRINPSLIFEGICFNCLTKQKPKETCNVSIWFYALINTSLRLFRDLNNSFHRLSPYSYAFIPIYITSVATLIVLVRALEESVQFLQNDSCYPPTRTVQISFPFLMRNSSPLPVQSLNSYAEPHV